MHHSSVALVSKFTGVRSVANVADWFGPGLFEVCDEMHLATMLPERVLVLEGIVARFAVERGVMDVWQVLLVGYNDIVPPQAVLLKSTFGA